MYADPAYTRRGAFAPGLQLEGGEPRVVPGMAGRAHATAYPGGRVAERQGLAGAGASGRTAVH